MVLQLMMTYLTRHSLNKRERTRLFPSNEPFAFRCTLLMPLLHATFSRNKIILKTTILRENHFCPPKMQILFDKGLMKLLWIWQENIISFSVRVSGRAHVRGSVGEGIFGFNWVNQTLSISKASTFPFGSLSTDCSIAKFFFRLNLKSHNPSFDSFLTQPRHIVSMINVGRCILLF